MWRSGHRAPPSSVRHFERTEETAGAVDLFLPSSVFFLLPYAKSSISRKDCVLFSIQVWLGLKKGCLTENHVPVTRIDRVGETKYEEKEFTNLLPQRLLRANFDEGHWAMLARIVSFSWPCCCRSNAEMWTSTLQKTQHAQKYHQKQQTHVLYWGAFR